MRRRLCWIMRRPGAGGKTRYYLRWYDDSGRMRTEAAGTVERDAETFRREREHLLNQGQFREYEPIALKDFQAEHLAVIATQVRPRTVKDHREVLEQFSTYCGSGRRLETLNARTIERWYAHRLGQGAPATANKHLRTLAGIFERALRRGYLRENPFRSVKPAREREPDVRILNETEIVRLLEACREPGGGRRREYTAARWHTFILLGLTTGMRSDEICHLEWRDVDLAGGTIAIRSGDEAGYRTKSGRARLAAILPELKAALEALREMRPLARWVFETWAGQRIHNNVTRDFKLRAARAGLPDVSPHDLRRTFVSHLQMAGVSAGLVRELAGHASITTTQRYYSRMLPDHLRQAPFRLAWRRNKDLRKIVQKSYRDPNREHDAKTA